MLSGTNIGSHQQYRFTPQHRTPVAGRKISQSIEGLILNRQN